MQFYRVSGLSVASEIDLPGLIAAVPSARRRSRSGAARCRKACRSQTASGPTWQIAGKQFLMRIPDIARFLLNDGSEIVVAPESEASAADIPIFILGTVFGILLHQREQIVLHASAVRVNGKAVLFCGPSGAGKSTLAAALAQRGYPLVTDDFCTLTADGAGAPLVHPDGRQLKLWAQAIERLDLAQQRGERVRAKPGEILRRAERGFHRAAGARRGLCVARGAAAARAGDRTAERGRRGAVAAAQRLSALLVRRMDQKANYFHAATTIANVAGIFHLTRALDFAKMPDVIASLERIGWSCG